MKIHELGPAEGSKKKNKRVGRGPGSGHGQTSCRGHKGQKARSGGGPARGFEGGQMPLQRRIPKRGFTNVFKKTFSVVNVGDLNRFSAAEPIDPQLLKTSGVVKDLKDGVKLLGRGDISHSITIRIHRASQAAREKIQRAGGSVEIIGSRSGT